MICRYINEKAKENNMFCAHEKGIKEVLLFACIKYGYFIRDSYRPAPSYSYADREHIFDFANEQKNNIKNLFLLKQKKICA